MADGITYRVLFFQVIACLDSAYVLMPKPTGFLPQSLALLCWLPENEVQQFFDEKESEVQREIKSCFKREQWKTQTVPGKRHAGRPMQR